MDRRLPPPATSSVDAISGSGRGRRRRLEQRNPQHGINRKRGDGNRIKLKAMLHLLELAWPAILMCHLILWGLATQDLYRRYVNNLSPTRPRFAQQFDVWPLAAFALLTVTPVLGEFLWFYLHRRL